MVVSGMPAAMAAFRATSRRVRFGLRVPNGRVVRRGQTLLKLAGPARALLAAERTALNFLGRLSGIATRTRQFVRAVPRGCRAKILDTRKTTPLLRRLEKEAVLHGGGENHRMTLSDAVLLKDNHVALFGGVARAVFATRRRLGRTVAIEVEVSTAREAIEALISGADRLLLDNMTNREIRAAVGLSGGRVPIEVSGGVTLDRIAALSRLGVDYISVGSITHSVRSAKISMDIFL